MAKRGNFRWIIIFLMFYITVANYIDRSAIAFAVGDIKRDLGITTAEIGLILGAFGLGSRLPPSSAGSPSIDGAPAPFFLSPQPCGPHRSA